ncbi:accessory factor UbiK family protein [Reinekea sp.]|jgi:BMFP domain-containing protein YqiC|uniref:accessory factor UbiK family protein n=1 Tax=Reinekea sp. TaxID=1970455 RepID=UPI003989CF01
MKIPNDVMEQLANQINELLSQGQQIKQEVRDNITGLIQQQVTKLDVVSREEFEVQQQILERTRAQLDQLQRQLDELEKNNA